MSEPEPASPSTADVYSLDLVKRQLQDMGYDIDVPDDVLRDFLLDIQSQSQSVCNGNESGFLDQTETSNIGDSYYDDADQSGSSRDFSGHLNESDFSLEIDPETAAAAQRAESKLRC
jgi:hypothetical protein